MSEKKSENKTEGPEISFVEDQGPGYAFQFSDFNMGLESGDIPIQPGAVMQDVGLVSDAESVSWFKVPSLNDVPDLEPEETPTVKKKNDITVPLFLKEENSH